MNFLYLKNSIYNQNHFKAKPLPSFGSAIAEMTYTHDTGRYRYGFNGKELDSETDLQNYGFRIYNPSIVKFLSVDPLTQSYPWYTPYQFAGNKPIVAIDMDGLEEYIIHQRSFAPWQYIGSVWGWLINSDAVDYWNTYTFSGDNRNFELGEFSSSRIRTATSFDIGKNTYTILKKVCDPTKLFTNDSEKKLLDKTQGTVEYNVTKSQSGTKTEANTFISSNNPFLISMANYPIEWGSNIIIDNQISKGYIGLTYSLNGKGFPAHESFIQDANGTKVFLSTYMAPGVDKVQEKLTDNHAYSVRARAEYKIDTDCDGNFTGTMKYRTQTGDTWSDWTETTIDEWNKLNIETNPAEDK